MPLIRRSRFVAVAAVAPIVLLAALSAVGAQPIGRAEKATLEVSADRSSYAAGSTATLAVGMTIEDEWHTNSHQPTLDYLIATRLEISAPRGWQPAEIRYPPGEMKTFAFADQPISVYEGQVFIFAQLEIPSRTEPGDHLLAIGLTYQACDDRSCLPPVTTTAEHVLTVGSAGELSSDPIFSTPSGTRPGSSGKLPIFLVLGVLGGLILNAMPCVLPVLSLKIFGLVKSAGRGRAEVVVGSLATAFGIVISFWALALAAVFAKAAGGAVGWGVQFQEPVFVTFLAIVVVLFCLNLWGVFEIPLPRRLAHLADSGPKEGIPGHLASGLFATLMATPCSAPFLGTAVGFALSQTAVTIFAVFTAVAIGMALPYLALAAAPGAAKLLPKPGVWMEKVKVFMGFLLAAAAVWLFYVLAAQMTRERVAFIELSVLALAMFLWMRHRSANSRPAKAVAYLGITASILAAFWVAADSDQFESARNVGSEQKLISWTVFDRAEAERLARVGNLVFVDVTADWCFTCKVNERLVLETAEIAGAFESHEVIAMKADWTNRSAAISRFLSDHGRYGIPFYLLYRPGRDPHVFGELLTKEELIEVLQDAAATR